MSILIDSQTQIDLSLSFQEFKDYKQAKLQITLNSGFFKIQKEIVTLTMICMSLFYFFHMYIHTD